MDFLPQKETSGTKALRALFESKTTLQQDFNSSPQLNSAAATGSKTGRDCPLQGWRSHNTPLRDTAIKRATQVGGGKATNGFPESYDRTSRYSHDRTEVVTGGSDRDTDLGLVSHLCPETDISPSYYRSCFDPDDVSNVFITVCECGYNREQLMVVKVVVVVKNKYQLHFTIICTAASRPKMPPHYCAANSSSSSLENEATSKRHDKYSPLLTNGGTPTRQTRDRISTSSSVRDRSALYLSRAAAIDATGGSTRPQEFIGAPGRKAKNSKMAEPARKITVSHSSHDEDDLPPPPPPPVPPRPLDYEGPSDLGSLPVPPPKETFSAFYQQRQKTELKRLFKHIHPDLRASLDDAVDDEIMKAVQPENTQAADAAYQSEVQSMRWIFENWNLDNIGDPHATKKLLYDEEMKGGDVRGTSSMFEHIDSTQQRSAERQISVRGDVRTSMWLFETQPLDSLNQSIREEGELVEAVLKEPIQTGDVRGTRLLFESKPLGDLGRCNSVEDHSFLRLKSELQEQKGDIQKTVKLFQADPCCAIKDNSGNIHEIKSICREEINSSNISTARWLFETQPLDLINKGTDGVKIIRGISLEEGQRGGVDQKKWMFETQSLDTIQEAVGVDRFEGTKFESEQSSNKFVRMVSVTDVHRGDVRTSTWLFENQTIDSLKGEPQEQSPVKTVHRENSQKGDVKRCTWLFESQPLDKIKESENTSVQATANSQRTAASCRVDENEKGNVNLYKSCIEKGDLHYLKSLHAEALGDEVDGLAEECIDIVQGDVKEAKRSLCQPKGQVERTISDVLPGDVKNTKKVFSSECSVSLDSCVPKEEIIPGDVSSAKQHLAVQAPVMVEKEDIVAGDIKATMQSLERAKQQSMHVEREIIKPGTIYDMDLSAQGPEVEESQLQKEVIISGDVKAAKRSLEMAKQQSMHMEREVITPGKIYNLNATAQEESSSAVMQCSSSSRCQQIKAYPKVSDAEKVQESHVPFEACQQRAVIVSNCAPELLPPFVGYECNGQTTEDETEEAIRGDVKAAIKSLQSAATEQKLLDKEDIVRGNVQLALKSLEKSSVNVSKGDYKDAMIYRNSGKNCSGRSKTVHKRCVVVSMPPSDTKLSPSISVTCEGQPSITTQNSTPNPVANGNSKSSTSESVTAPPLPQKTSEKLQKQKPALPPKPQWTKSVVVEEQNISATSAPEVARPIENNIKRAMIPSEQSQRFPTPSTDKLQETMCANKTSHETYHQNYVEEAVQDSNQTFECLPMDSKSEEIKTKKKTAPLTGSKSDCQ
ncbi:Xin actin-binding repeat-containing protein 1, partial [Nibea albiflora]